MWSSDTSSESQENVVSLLVIVFSLYFRPSVAGYSGLIYFTVNLLSLLIWVGGSHLSSLCPCSFLQMLRFTQHSSQSCCQFLWPYHATITIYNIVGLHCLIIKVLNKISFFYIIFPQIFHITLCHIYQTNAGYFVGKFSQILKYT